MRRPRRRSPASGARFLAFGIIGAALAAGVTVFAQSGTWSPAPATPPQQNVPGPVWNTTTLQNASFNVSGSGQVGSGAFGGFAPDAVWRVSSPSAYFGNGTLGTIIGAGGGQNAGDISTDGVLTIKNSGSFKLLSGAGAGKVLTSDAGGVASWQTAAAGGCAANVFDHLTATNYAGNVGSYATVNTNCGSGAHICTPDEVLATLRCAPATLPASGNAWVANGPPGFTSPASNDCAGWTSSAASAYGTFWQFGGATGGKAFATSCSLALQVACCK